jgi:hypothetical protein
MSPHRDGRQGLLSRLALRQMERVQGQQALLWQGELRAPLSHA